MKKWLFSVLLSVVSLSLSALPVIVLPEKPTLQEKTAARELALHLKLVCGKELSVTTENLAGRGGQLIYVGATGFAAAQKTALEKFAPEEWLVKAVDESRLILAGGFPRGTLYAVYEYLERNHGFLWPDVKSVYCKKDKNIHWTAGMNYRGKPAFAYRSIYSSFVPGSELWKIRNRQNTFHTVLPKKFDAWGIAPAYGSPWFCHTFYEYTRHLQKKDHDILSLNSGTRRVSTSRHGMGQICYSNPKTAQFFAGKLLEWIPRDRQGKEKWQYPSFYMLSTNDNRNECECADCRRVARTAGYSALKTRFVNQVSRIVTKKYPDVVFQTDAYGLHAYPAKNDVKPDKNVVMMIAYGALDPTRPRDTFRSYAHPENRITRQLHLDWRKQASLAVWDYWLDCIRPDYPSTLLPAMVDNIRFYKKLNVIYLMGECPFPSRVSLWYLRIYIANRFMTDPSRDLDTEIKRFMTAYYGKAAPFMFKYQKLLERTTPKLNEPVSAYAIDRRHDLDEAFFAEAEKLLAEAAESVRRDKASLERVEEEWSVVARAKIEKFHVSDPEYVNKYHRIAVRMISRHEGAYRSGQRKKAVDQLRDAALARVPRAAGFEKQTLITDYSWPLLSLARFNKKVKDPDAAGGYAVVFGNPKEDLSKYPGVSMGVYDQKKRVYAMPAVTIPKEAAPLDEKYHWYDLGRCRLPENPLIYLHWSWTLQLVASASFRSPEIYDNDVRIYVSLKLQGPAYVKGSVKPDMYAVDRVLIVRGDLNSQKLLHPLPEKVSPEQVEADLAAASLKLRPLKADRASLVQMSFKSAQLRPGAKFYVLVKDNTGKVSPVTNGLILKKDGKYHLYKVYSGPLTRDFRMGAGRAKIDLSPYFAMAEAEKQYDVMLSIKCISSGEVFIDRCLILKK